MKKSITDFEIKSKSGGSYFLFSQPLSIMPGEFLHVYDLDNKLQDKYEVKSVLIPAREEITVFTENDTIRGTTRQEITVLDNWQDSPTILALRNGRETSQIRFADIKRIKGPLYLNINADVKTLNNLEYNISFYQKAQFSDNTMFDKIKWTSGLSDKNQTIYDMFTPPIIFIHDGQLTTKLPEKEKESEEIEPFGLSLVEVTKAEYPFRLKSWVGQTPYFEDLTVTESSGAGVRNRIEVGKSYKRTLTGSPVNPVSKFVITMIAIVFVVQYFAVQQYRNPDTGGSNLLVVQ